jgi:hypothetical protein
MKHVLLGASLAALLGLSSVAVAQDHHAGIKVGTLSCHERAGVGLIVGSTRPVHCVFDGPHGSTEYDGHITKIGVDIGIHGKTYIVWSVFAPSDTVGPGALSGDYAGVSADVAAGLSAGANVLVGGSDRSISLQPLSIEGGTGVAIAAGIGGLTLDHVPGSYTPPS